MLRRDLGWIQGKESLFGVMESVDDSLSNVFWEEELPVLKALRFWTMSVELNGLTQSLKP